MGAGYPPIYQFFDQWWFHLDEGFDFVTTDALGRKTLQLRPTNGGDLWTTSIHAATGKLQGAMFNFHFKAVRYLHKNATIRLQDPKNLVYATGIGSEVAMRAPLVRTICRAQDEVDYRTRKVTVKFPRLMDLEPANKTGSTTVNVSEPIRSRLRSRGFLNTISLDGLFTDERQVLIIPIDIWDDSASSLGLVILFANEVKDNRDGCGGNEMACSVDARWAKARSIIDPTRIIDLAYEFEKGITRNILNVQLDVGRPDRLGLDQKRPADGALQRIRIRPGWYDVLSPTASMISPTLPQDSDTQQTALERLIQLKYEPDRMETLQTNKPEYKNQLSYATLTSFLVTDSISRCRLIPNIDPSNFLTAWSKGEWTVEDRSLAETLVRFGDPKESLTLPEMLEPGESTRQVIRMLYNGYAIYVDSWFDYLCIVLFLLHAGVASQLGSRLLILLGMWLSLSAQTGQIIAAL
ncbi:hypothetical protein HJFPF1_12953 [Paramyrothecium foliicola]|nr:hypothetical protein HJFPF1_12953 [Paramyrothecium foliicola]